MQFWLVKSEPEEFSFDDLKKEVTTQWTGVRNYAARNHLRAMEIGDLCLFYHSVSDKEIVGLAKITRDSYPDPTAEGDTWSAVDITYVKPLNKKIKHATLKTMPDMQQFELIRISRLSVMPVSPDRWETLLEMAETDWR